MRKANSWLLGGLVTVAIFVWLLQVVFSHARGSKPRQEAGFNQTIKAPHISKQPVYICGIAGNQDQFKKWLGTDYGRLVILGDSAMRAFEVLAMPGREEEAMRRVKAIAKEHDLRIIY